MARNDVGVPTVDLPLWVGPHTTVIELRGSIGMDQQINVAAIERTLDQTRSRLSHVHLAIDCTGGNVVEAERIYEVLRALPCPVSAHVELRCYSAAVELFLAASLRSASANAEFLIHPTRRQRDSLPEIITAPALAEVLSRLSELDEKTARLMHHRTGAPKEWIRTEMETEDPIDIVVAVERGFVHQIGNGALNPCWPAIASQLPGELYVPPRMLSANFLDACHTLARIEAIKASHVIAVGS